MRNAKNAKILAMAAAALALVILIPTVYWLAGRQAPIAPEAVSPAPVSPPPVNLPTAQAPPPTVYTTTPPPTHVDIENNFPSLFLTAPLHPFEQTRTQRQNGSLTLVSDTAAFNFTNENISVRGRGNTTWNYGGEKLPLRIRFDAPRTFLDSDYAHREWILLANHFDRSLLRNHGAFYLSGLLGGMPWTPFSRFVHLYINGEYYGVYELTEERDIAPGRVDIAFDQDPAVSEYFFELNGHMVGWRAVEFEEGVDYFMVLDRAYQLRWPTANMAGSA
ncbi:MAG: CotH kinase family protein, partial [Defluviitaleaceae bacterium]|nr:CotH kinase family protein [Defluviitaleaceae bacterium]